MSFTRSQRSGRIAACTAVAVAAGMLLAGPAAADGAPKPPTKVVKPADKRAGGTLPKSAPVAGTQKLQRSGQATEGSAAVNRPRFDVDSDGADDILYRGNSGSYYLKASSATGADTDFFMERSDPNEDFKDVIPAGDLNGNGRPELLQLSITGKLSMVEATSAYYTSTAQWSSGGWNAYNKLIAAGDLNGDGRPDLLARAHNGTLYLYPGNGRAGADTPYGDRIEIGTGWAKFDQITAGADFSGDGIPDVMATLPNGELYIYNGTGGVNSFLYDGEHIGNGWTTYNQISTLVSNNGSSYVFGRDLSGQAYLYQGLGAGRLADRFDFGKNWNHQALIVGQGGIPAHGKSELWGRTGEGTLFAYAGQNNGNFTDRQQISDDGGFPANEVGISLASSVNTSSFPSMLWTYGGGLYQEGNYVGGGWGIYKSLVGVGDLNNDGYGDLLALDGSNVLWFYESKGTVVGFFDRVRVGGGWGIYNKLLGAGDITGDGRADLVARGTDGALYVYPGTGSGTAPFSNRVQIGSGGWNGFTKLAAPGDITGDGLGDIVGTDSSGTAYRYEPTGLQGLNTFSGRGTIGTGWNTYKELF
ncbi:VCBS repeat-containing protein [Streptomyces sp. ISL-66]|uniref:FG-GAP repeat domain-containing protein n=1 Tax=Streptomyces sp. ISL-66 TaxID=2819186 RepID=UPI001BE87C1B|nr:VCBS repeat-containing protein [Streptomyces sp. ISL-66]MBT2466770.1 VCBS repeat-containing protein [Streptomyces sp. ISL-66]